MVLQRRNWYDWGSSTSISTNLEALRLERLGVPWSHVTCVQLCHDINFWGFHRSKILHRIHYCCQQWWLKPRWIIESCLLQGWSALWRLWFGSTSNFLKSKGQLICKMKPLMVVVLSSFTNQKEIVLLSKQFLSIG